MNFMPPLVLPVFPVGGSGLTGMEQCGQIGAAALGRLRKKVMGVGLLRGKIQSTFLASRSVAADIFFLPGNMGQAQPGTVGEGIEGQGAAIMDSAAWTCSWRPSHRSAVRCRAAAASLTSSTTASKAIQWHGAAAAGRRP